MSNEVKDKLFSARTFFLIAGPCVIEEETLMLQTAEYLSDIAQRHKIPLVFKSSFLKANRTSADSFQGPGLQEGLKLLQNIANTYNVPILTDVHDVSEIKAVSEVCDIIQIPAFLCRQTQLIQAAAKTGKIVNLKKGQFMAPEDMKNAAEKVTGEGNSKVILTERGTTFGYHNLVVDFRSFAIMNSFGFPVVYDVTHSLQKPSMGKHSGGSPEYAGMMAQAAIATGYVHGLFIETHPNPPKALSDSASMLALDKLEALIVSCINIKEALSI